MDGSRHLGLWPTNETMHLPPRGPWFCILHSEILELVAGGQSVLALDPTLIGQALPGGPIAADAMVMGTVGERPLGVQVAQVLAAAESFGTSHAIESFDAVTFGPRAGLAVLCAAALRPSRFSRLSPSNMPDTLKAFLQAGASYDQTPEIYCFGLLESFDRKDLEQLAAK